MVTSTLVDFIVCLLDSYLIHVQYVTYSDSLNGKIDRKEMIQENNEKKKTAQ